MDAAAGGGKRLAWLIFNVVLAVEASDAAAAAHKRRAGQQRSQFTGFGRLELEWCERKILLNWLELKLVAGVV